MEHKITKVFDNIGFKFHIQDNKFIASESINGFTRLSDEHIGYYIPYLARNSVKNEIETGVGQIKYNSLGDIVIERVRVVKSSNNNTLVNFSNSPNNEFYIFANQFIFDRSIDQVVIVDSNYDIKPIKALYLVDCSNNDITCKLPAPEANNGLIVEFKIIANNYHLIIRDHKHSVVSNLKDNDYIRLACNGQSWAVINKDITQSTTSDDTAAVLSNDMSIMSTPEGAEQSLQYKSGSDFQGAGVYWDDINYSLLLGADNSTDAQIVLPSSGNQPVIFNNQREASDFIVHGSGNRNLFFAYDGRLGINIPSGTRPSTIFHVINNICQEGFRLENRNVCHPANMTLFHKPSSAITNNSVVAQINLSSKDNNNNKTDYAKIEARAIDTNSLAKTGGIDLTIASGSSQIPVFSADTADTQVGYSGINIQINQNNDNILLRTNRSQLLLDQSTLDVNTDNISLDANNIVIGSGGSIVNIPGAAAIGTVSATSLQSSNITLPNIAPSSFLTLDSNNEISPSNTMSLNSLGTINLPIAPNKILNTTTNGSITGVYSLDDYFLTERDIVWHKYSPKSASVCLRQVTFDSPVPVNEFVVGDQVVLTSFNGNFYRNITNIDIAGEEITGLVLDQAVTQVTTANFTVYSITQGGYLSMAKAVDAEVISDSTSNILSIRPLTDTTFNTNQKDINFSVYGLDDNPALYIKANTGRLGFQSGVYFPFATQQDSIFSIVVTTGGAGISNIYSAANIDYNTSTNLFSGIVSDVGSNGATSYYGTYDQNGNAAEWVEKPYSVESRDKEEFVCGGSYLTTTASGIGLSGVKSLESLPRQSGFEYVGFRVASLYNLADSRAIINATGLNISFVGVVDPKNAEDASPTYLKTGDKYSTIVLNNLGVVNNTYRISRHEITNDQYCKFLNAVAKNSDRGLYDSRMSSHDVGGIDRIFDESFIYTTKPHMANKPVVFVNYISSIRFINWLHHGALSDVAEEDVDYILDIGAYNIAAIGNSSFNIVKSSYRKYWLPDLNEWHKAAYYKPIDVASYRGTSTVSVKRPEPYLVASGVDSQAQPAQLYANLSVSGWLYVDHLIVGDGTIRSARRFTGITEPDVPNDEGDSQSTPGSGIVPPRVNLNPQWNNPNAIVSEDKVSCVSAGCEFQAKPLRLENDVLALCSDIDLLDTNNTPWWCQQDNSGPGWFQP